MKKYLVGGYYDSRIFEGVEGKTPFGKDISIYDLDSALKLGFVEPVEDWYQDKKEDEDREWYELLDWEKIEYIIKYTETDEIASLIGFETLEEATKYVKDVLNEIAELEQEFEYAYREQDYNGIYNDVYIKKESRKTKVLVSKAGGNASSNSFNWRVSIPNTWISELGINKEDRDVTLVLDKEGKQIIVKK